jgi:transcriptional regulator with XRE-family HTH domain
MSYSPYRTLAGRVTRARALRLAAGISQTELARRAGVSQTVVSGIERGMSTSPLLMTCVADALSTNADELHDRVEYVPGVGSLRDLAEE